MILPFLLNLFFSLFEFAGGLFTGSAALLSDALHDLGDALGIGLSYFFERKSRRAPDARYTYGYRRFSLLGGAITTLILLFGSIVVIVHAVSRILHPIPIHYDGMIFFAVVGVCVNVVAFFLSHKGTSLNQKAVTLHLLEDALGWVIVLIGALVMRWTDFALLDPILSILLSGVILTHAFKLFGELLHVFLEATPNGLDPEQIRAALCAIDGVSDVHHIHLWSMDGNTHAATMHVVAPPETKPHLKEVLHGLGISHVTLELEDAGESCHEKECHISHTPHSCCHHH
ncbi:MAG: cation transporter [Oscillospiraceae bacterium]|nr:cation transporter [Oscillospiraceae bacterium]